MGGGWPYIYLSCVFDCVTVLKNTYTQKEQHLNLKPQNDSFLLCFTKALPPSLPLPWPAAPRAAALLGAASLPRAPSRRPSALPGNRSEFCGEKWFRIVFFKVPIFTFFGGVFQWFCFWIVFRCFFGKWRFCCLTPKISKDTAGLSCNFWLEFIEEVMKILYHPKKHSKIMVDFDEYPHLSLDHTWYTWARLRKRMKPKRLGGIRWVLTSAVNINNSNSI